MYEDWVYERLRDEFKILWGGTNNSVHKIIVEGLLSLDKVAIKKLNSFHKKYYNKFLVNAHHRKVFKINQVDFNKITNEIDNLLGNVILNVWLTSEIEIIITNSSQGKSHIKQNGSIVCPGKSPKPNYNIEIESKKGRISYLLLKILGAKSKSEIIKSSNGNEICWFCIMRIVGKTEQKTYLKLTELQAIIRKNVDVINKL